MIHSCTAGDHYEQGSTLKTTGRLIAVVAAVALGFFCGHLIGAGIGLAAGFLGYCFTRPSKSEERARTEAVFVGNISRNPHTATQRRDTREGFRSGDSSMSQGLRRRTPGANRTSLTTTQTDRRVLQQPVLARVRQGASKVQQNLIEALSKKGHTAKVITSIEDQKNTFIDRLVLRKIEKTEQVLADHNARTKDDLEEILKSPRLETKKRQEILSCINCPLITIAKGKVSRNLKAVVSITSEYSGAVSIKVSENEESMITPKYYKLQLKEDGSITSGGVHLGVLKDHLMLLGLM